MPQPKMIVARCPQCAGETFGLRLVKDEAVGVAKCLGCDRDFLILDSADYANESIVDEGVVEKAPLFREVTARLSTWLKSEFVSWRGADCFDNPDEHLRIFGDHFRSKAERKRRPRM